ncbi:MAG: hypothetical protein IPM49_12050 [Flavobacteriales bacterium]|jgi:hypothetical protein|nr:hypothetical protein [Flavobacteriales bacterium]HMQ76080.1 hypothetical protein [Flavobacteriales bacterium]HMR27946.1 hypothetical protein [Flavobacteriales bacterium]
MQQIWFGIGHFIQKTFDWFLTPFGWLPPVLFSCVLGFGAIYWMRLQGRYNRKAKEQGGML